jgi:hypothetical protein
MDKSLRGSFSGLYCLLAQQPKNFQDVQEVANKCCGGKRDECGVVVEITARAASERLTSGGVEADHRVVQRGVISHMKTGKEDRWCVPWDLVGIRSLWFSPDAMPSLAETNFLQL